MEIWVSALWALVLGLGFVSYTSCVLEPEPRLRRLMWGLAMPVP